MFCCSFKFICSNHSMWPFVAIYVPKIHGDIPPSLMVLFSTKTYIFMRWVWVEFWEAPRKNMCKSKSILRYEIFSCRTFCDIGSSSEKRWLSAKCQNQVHLTLDLLTLAIWWRWWCLLIWWWYIYILQAVNLDPDLAFVLQNAAQELAVTHTQHWTVMLKRFTITLMIMIHSKNWEQS